NESAIAPSTTPVGWVSPAPPNTPSHATSAPFPSISSGAHRYSLARIVGWRGAYPTYQRNCGCSLAVIGVRLYGEDSNDAIFGRCGAVMSLLIAQAQPYLWFLGALSLIAAAA